ncbi:MAG: prephenate dehydrogenase/arogenate dehydrogenase family protein [Candidatus Bathyarchaeota archaeon]|nr:prephenate dehydrogenase/arogenate dehydrogenase family protein [Candidatus Bathyarchaeota archaeon]
MNVSIIGGGGRMGRWLVRHFLSQGHNVRISDIETEEATAFAESVGASFSEDNVEAVEDADLTVVSTPITVAARVLREIAPSVKEDSIVAEISSLKSDVVPVLLEMAETRVKPLSIHPLFGPGIKRLEEEKIALIPVVDLSSEIESVSRFFPGAEVVVVEADEHDRAMALTLSLPHFLNILFASVVSEEDLVFLKKLGGTTFTLQLTLSESVMAESPELYASIQINDEYTVRYLDRFLSKAETVREWIAKKDAKSFTEFYSSAQTSLSKDEDFSKSYERIYKALESF